MDYTAKIRQQNLLQAAKDSGLNDREFAQSLGLTAADYAQLKMGGDKAGGRNIGPNRARKFETKLNKNPGWMDLPPNSVNEKTELYSVTPPSDGDEIYEMEYYDAKGSCGGGSLNGDDIVKGLLTREVSFFLHYKAKPENCKAIYADGDSMADYIVDGDLVIFDISKKTPISGEIFLLRYQEGLRIKELHQQVNGKWKIRSRNPSWGDEEIADKDEIEIIGQYVTSSH